MKKTLLKLTMMVAFMAAMAVGQAQNNVPITLVPGWNWISYPNAEAMGIATALGDFTPVPGDVIRSQADGTATYMNGVWRGRLSQFIPGMGYKYYSMRTENVELVFAQAASSLVTTAEPTDITATSAVVGGTVTLGEGNHVFARGVCWSMEPNPDVDDSHSIDATVTGFLSVTLTGLTPETTYYVRAYVVTDYGLAYGEELSFTTDIAVGDDHAYVDLGLPSGLLWATCNVGATAPEEYGDYFAWGETTTKDTYNWSTYQYCNGSYNTLTKYCNDSSYGYNGFTDDLTTLQPDDDAATTNWGNDWRMPTQAEFQELLDNTTVTWTTQNGVNGHLFTANNGNSLFLPAAGFYGSSYLYDVGSIGYYWSSSLNTGNPRSAWILCLNSDNCYMGSLNRGYGLSVRPVRSSGQNAPTGAINGKFTINDNGDQVYFSQGNLQYQASTDTWKFAENQYDYVGDANSNISSTYDGWIDLFGWGTSGYNHGAICYQPWSTTSNTSYYYAYGNYQYNLYDQTGQADWGYNWISNGGNTANQWRTLTQPEWNYVFNARTTTSGIRYAKANVNNVNGVILLPDDWSSSTYSLSNTNSSGASFSSNTLTASQWNTLEQAGAVFLPAAGYRGGTSILSVGFGGYYWSASYLNSYNAYYVYFDASYLDTNRNGYNRYFGSSVRVVCPVE